MSSTSPYSAFFSSGLLAPPLHICTTTTPLGPSPIASPVLGDDIEDIELMSGVSLLPSKPTLNRSSSSYTYFPPSSASSYQTSFSHSSGADTPTSPRPPGTPRLRRRRSSLTANMSTLGSIKSPTRAAGNAFVWDRVVSRATSIEPGVRERSGSLGQIDMNVSGNVEWRDKKATRSRRQRRTQTSHHRSGPTSAPPEGPLPPLPSFPFPQRPRLQLSLSAPQVPYVKGPLTAPGSFAGAGMETFTEGDSYEEEVEMQAPTSPVLGCED